MNTGIRLIPLKCIQCSAPIPAAVNEVAWRCAVCGTGQQLDDEGLLPLDIYFAAAPSGRSPRWYPYWAMDGCPVITDRQTQSWRSEGFDWRRVRRFWLPAFEMDAKRFQEFAVNLTLQQPSYQAAAVPPGVAVQGCVVTPQDARKLAEFVVMSIEAKQPDSLRSLEFTLDLGRPVLWMLPG